jgi:hypothetical protein
MRLALLNESVSDSHNVVHYFRELKSINELAEPYFERANNNKNKNKNNNR